MNHPFLLVFKISGLASLSFSERVCLLLSLLVWSLALQLDLVTLCFPFNYTYVVVNPVAQYHP